MLPSYHSITLKSVYNSLFLTCFLILSLAVVEMKRYCSFMSFHAEKQKAVFEISQLEGGQ